MGELSFVGNQVRRWAKTAARSPTDPSMVWTDLKPTQLAGELLRRGFEVGRHTAAKLLERAGYRRRSLRKELITGQIDPQQRDQQFRHIDALRRHAQAQAQGNPVLCVETKKKELLGWLHRPGQCYSPAVQGIYDYFDTVGFMTLGTSHETSAFVCEAIALAWEEDRQARYANATEIAHVRFRRRQRRPLAALQGGSRGTERAPRAALAHRPLPTL